MARPRRNGKESPIDNKQKALAEQEEKLRLKMQALQQLIEEAPRVAEETEKRRKQDMTLRASQYSRRAESPNNLVARRYDVSTTFSRTGTKRLRAEQKEARLKFIVLCIVFLACLLLLWTRFR